MFTLGCSKAEKVYVPELVRQTVPDAMLMTNDVPLWNGGTNAEMMEHAAHLRDALEMCNADKKAIKRAILDEAVSK